jgi:zinc-ribbon domain
VTFPEFLLLELRPWITCDKSYDQRQSQQLTEAVTWSVVALSRDNHSVIKSHANRLQQKASKLVPIHGPSGLWSKQRPELQHCARVDATYVGRSSFFENSVCVTCGSAVGYSREHGTVIALSESHSTAQISTAAGALDSRSDIHLGLCFSCRLTRTRPAEADTVGLALHWIAEAAKRRLICGLDEPELPIKSSDGSGGLAFDLLSSTHGKIITGYQPNCMLRRKTCNLSILSPTVSREPLQN